MNDSVDIWRLCEDLSIFQAVMLSLGYDPSAISSHNIQSIPYEKYPQDYDALKRLILSAIDKGMVEGKIIYESDFNGNEYLCLDESQVNILSLIAYYKKIKYSDKYFNLSSINNKLYADKSSAFYSAKLHAAMDVWEAISQDSELRKNKSPKQAIIQWLNDNRENYDLSNTAINEIAKIVNWQSEGGAPKTLLGGTGFQEPEMVPKALIKLNKIDLSNDWDPFGNQPIPF